MGSSWRGNPFFRKGTALLNRIPRGIRAGLSNDESYARYPPALANSFPKSGTHLLNQLLSGLPRVKSYGTFWASMPSLTYREKPPRRIAKAIGRTAPGELASAHLFYADEVAEALNRRTIVHFFIYRDLRDVAVSEAHYLTRMNRWHRLHPLFASLPDDASRISLAILGSTKSDLSVSYPNIAERFARYRRWLSDPAVFAVRFEDLIGSSPDATVRSMVNHYAAASKSMLDVDDVVDACLSAVNPSRSHTFRKGEAGGWRRVFSETHRRQMEAVAGDLLHELGFEG